MWATHPISTLALTALLALSMGCSNGAPGVPGARGPAGEAGAPGAPGEAGPPGPWLDVGNIQGSVTATSTGKALANVSITSAPGAAMATTAADGTYGLSLLPIGAYTLTFTRDGYLTKTVSGVNVSYGGNTKVAVTLDTDATSDGPTIVVADDLLAGFGQPVTVTATVTDQDSDPSKLTYAWTQLSGVPATIGGANTAAISFTTLTIAQAKPTLTPRFGALGFDPDETGNYVLQLTVTDPEGHATTTTVTVTATAPTTSLANVPLGIPVYLQGDGAPQSTWSWALDTSLVQGGSHATLAGANGQFPSFTPDALGSYTLTESVSGKSLVVHGGTWVGVTGRAAACMTCHDGTTAPDKFTPWASTAHATTMQRGLDGQLGPTFGPSCLSCHALGDSPLANNGGFDDLAAKDGWTFPSTLQPGNWAALSAQLPDLAALGNVQCESCHGPQFSDSHPNATTARISWGSEVCASCHQDAPSYYKPAQWQSSLHADLSLPLEVATVEALPDAGTASCGRCHAAQGYAQYVGQLANGYTGILTTDGMPPAANGANAANDSWLASIGLTNALVQPQTCAACHDPHDATNPAQLRMYDVAPGGLPNGQGAVAGAGAGVVCMACHNSGNGEYSNFVPPPASISEPHDGPQTDVLYGFNAYFMPRYNPSPHLAVADTCVGCHYATPTAAEGSAHQTSNHSFIADLTICSSCHASAIDGAGIQASVQSQLDALDTQIYQKVQSSLANAVNASGAYDVRIVDPATGYASSWVASGVAPSNVVLTAAPISIGRPQPIPHHGGLSTLVFTMASAVTFEAYDASGADKGPLTLSTFDVELAGVQVGAAPLFPGSSIIAKAIWNEELLHNDGTLGIHNLPFVDSVLASTGAQLSTLP